ncbi:uncharacterized protein PHACADRAFT_23667 [Phanerochaete carnosa HHB-10118-sp]|uniref:HMG box domain-containing protein n=1 Tax=Phanerochaete carnosa (strain HHB-10118-sp) TaxID=650164 RepID=K5WM41_PHACS|nr:uncharacterized protein PHACADRAFT_23667 [Phanerochaete carnosa HHB-10118-sp]EKM60254.1 hypothetical protein PHACADRAFT_23667 [Phanerochaete carnosa HHB-10118-sp]
MAAEDHPRGGDGEGLAPTSALVAGWTHDSPGASDELEMAGNTVLTSVLPTDDPHHALTSQTLNADGTPKRPMNAFMIFARKRRPQISAANQMMRTGDISKILSKEWNAMEMAEKKFYLDQAKKLKDNFNNKYPDYVYRRRPNNSRKKRKPDADAQSPTEHSVGGDTDDASVDDPSPVDAEDQSRDPHSAPYLYRPSSGTTGMYESGDSFLSSQATPSYPYVADIPPAQYGQTPRLSHPDQSLPQNSLTPLRIPSLAETVASAQGQGLSYSASRGSSSQATITSPVHASHSPQAYWDPRHAGRPDEGRSNWPSLDMSVSPQQRTVPPNRSDAFSSQVPQRPWSSSASSATSSSSGGASGSHYANSQFPTLTSPFFPSQSPIQRSAEAVSPSPSSHPSSSPEYFSRASYPGATSTVPSVPQPGGSGYQLHHGTSSQWGPQYPRAGNEAQQRSLPALQPISTYPLPSTSSASPPPSSAGAHSSHIPYWDRSRYDGR